MTHLLHESIRSLRAEVVRLGHGYPHDGDDRAREAWQRSFDAASGDLQRFELALRCAQSGSGR